MLKLLMFVLTKQEVNPLRLLKYTQEWVVCFEQNVETHNTLSQKIKPYITKTLDIISLLINLLSVEKLILKKGGI